MKIVYICSPLRGNYSENIKKASKYSRAAALKGYMPITPHIYFTQFLNDDNPAERELGMALGIELLKCVDELWFFEDENGGLSEGMVKEIQTAHEKGIPVLDGFTIISPAERTHT